MQEKPNTPNHTKNKKTTRKHTPPPLKRVNIEIIMQKKRIKYIYKIPSRKFMIVYAPTTIPQQENKIKKIYECMSARRRSERKQRISEREKRTFFYIVVDTHLQNNKRQREAKYNNKKKICTYIYEIAA